MLIEKRCLSGLAQIHLRTENCKPF